MALCGYDGIVKSTRTLVVSPAPPFSAPKAAS